MVLYLDLIIIKEFIMDFILIITTVSVLKKKTSSYLIIISSLIGVLETILDILINFSIPIRWIIKIIVSILMIKIIYKTKDLKEFAKEIFVFYIVSFIYAGITISLMFSRSLNEFLNTGSMIGKYSSWIIILSILLSIILIKITFKLISKNIRKDNIICDLEICIDKKILNLKVLLDTGNLLKDPILRFPVVIVEKSILRDILESTNIKRKIYLIPYETLGSKNKVLFGIKPEYIRLSTNNNYVIKDVILGLYDGKLSKCNSYKGLVRHWNIR